VPHPPKRLFQRPVAGPANYAVDPRLFGRLTRTLNKTFGTDAKYNVENQHSRRLDTRAKAFISVEIRSQLISQTNTDTGNLIASIQTSSGEPHRECERLLILEATQMTMDDRIAEPAVAYGTPVEHRWLTVDEYLEFEANSEHRHEYIDGAIYAMSSASENHALVSGNLFAAIHGHLRGGPCKPYSSNFKVRLKIDQKDLFYYPDAMVACGREGIASHYLHYPKLVVEVLSPSTESIDRREKFLSYKQIPTVEEYVLASQIAAQIMIYRRTENWAPRVCAESDGIAVFQSIGLSLPLRQIYEGVL
jgi:Uma2 family endonuclease